MYFTVGDIIKIRRYITDPRIISIARVEQVREDTILVEEYYYITTTQSYHHKKNSHYIDNLLSDYYKLEWATEEEWLTTILEGRVMVD